MTRPVLASEQALGDLLMAKKPDPLLAELAKAAEEGATRSKLAAWMRANHDEFAELVRTRGTAWEEFARRFIGRGLMPKPEDYDDPGEKGDAARARAGETAKRAWNRTRRRFGATGGTEGGPQTGAPTTAPAINPASARGDKPPVSEGDGDDLTFAGGPKKTKGGA